MWCGAGRELRSIGNGEQNSSSRLMDSAGCARSPRRYGNFVWRDVGWECYGVGCKSHVEATCGARDAMEVCRSSAMRPQTGFCRPSTKAGVGGTRWKCAMSISGPELVFVHTQTHPDTRGAYPQAHPRPPTHISPGGRGLCVQKIRY